MGTNCCDNFHFYFRWTKNYRWTKHYRWIKKTKDGRIVCRAHPEVDLEYNGWTYYCPNCYKSYVNSRKRDIHMYRKRPYRRFKPVRKGNKSGS